MNLEPFHYTSTMLESLGFGKEMHKNRELSQNNMQCESGDRSTMPQGGVRVRMTDLPIS